MNNKFNKSLREYMKLPYTVMLKRDEEGDIIARVKELEGCVADGQDEIEALRKLETMKELWISAALEAGQEIPKPDEDDELPSGKWLTRVPRSLHKNLIQLAKQEGVSLNQLVAVSLAETVGRKAAVLVKREIPETVVPSLHGTGDYGVRRSPSPLRIAYSSENSPVPHPDPDEERLFMNRLGINRLSMVQKAPEPRQLLTRRGGKAVA